jgi:hypothetical protein
MDIGKLIEKWDAAKKKISALEEKIEKYKVVVTKEMNKKGVERLSGNGFTVSRRRNTRSYLTKDNVPPEIWKQYSTKCSYDSFFISKG